MADPTPLTGVPPAPAPRPVPEGKCPRHYRLDPYSSGNVDWYAACDDDDDWFVSGPPEEMIAKAVTHRNAVALDAYPDLAARIEALKAENADLVATVAEMRRSRDNDPTWKRLDALAEQVLAAEAAAQSATSGLDETQPAPGKSVESYRPMQGPDVWHVWGPGAHRYPGDFATEALAIAKSHDIYRAESAPAVAAATRELRAERDRLRRDLANAEGDARILAHAYEHDSRPPPAVIERALSYRAGRPAPEEGPKT